MQNTVKKSSIQKRPTQKEVAERAGVSQGVVLQVLNDRQGAIRVNPDTRERVLQTIEDMGYAPNLAVRWLEVSALAGLSAPQRYSFVVLGDPLNPRPGIRSWAALEIPRREMGTEAVRMLNAVLNGGPVETLSLPCRWVPGDPLGRVPGGAGQP